MKLPSTPTGGPFTLAWFSQQWAQIAQVINGNIEFGNPSAPGNIKGVWYSGTTPATPDEEFSIPVNLNYVPNGWIMISLDQAAVVYKGATSWTSKAITLKCNTASVNVVLLVI